VRHLILAICLLPITGALSVQQDPAQNTPSEQVLQSDESQPPDITGYCSNLASASEGSPALATVCAFALSQPAKLPDIICERVTRRSWQTKASEVDLDDINHSDVIAAQVTYRDGQEYEDNVRVDGKPSDAASRWSSGAWSNGEFASSLSTIFAPSSRPEFRFHREERLHSIRAIVFDFRVSAGNNKLYCLRSADKAWFPEFSGKLWLDKTDFRLLRLERETSHMPGKPITRVRSTTDYSLVPLGDGTKMVLPTHADVLVCGSYAVESCDRNIVTFSHWQKFRAKTKIIPNPNNRSFPNCQ